MRKLNFILCIILLLPFALATPRIVETEFTINYNNATGNFSITYEDDSGSKVKYYDLNTTATISETIDTQFIRDLEDSETCGLFEQVRNLTEECVVKVEAYDRLIGKKETTVEVNEKFTELNKNLDNWTTIVTEELVVCQTEKDSCEQSKNNLYTQRQLDDELDGKYGLIYVVLPALAVLIYYNKGRIFGAGETKAKKNNPTMMSNVSRRTR